MATVSTACAKCPNVFEQKTRRGRPYALCPACRRPPRRLTPAPATEAPKPETPETQTETRNQ